MSRVSLKKIMNEFESYISEYPTINQFEDRVISEDQVKNVDYPVMYINSTGKDVNGGEHTYNFVAYFLTLLERDGSNLTSAISDMEDAADDFIKNFNERQIDLRFWTDDVYSQNTIFFDFKDILCGVVVNFTVTTCGDRNEANLPI